MTPTETAWKVLIVDDHPVVREGLKLCISQYPEFVVTGEASAINEAMEMIQVGRPDVVVVDISLRFCSGIDLIGMIRGLHAGIHVLCWSMHVDALYAERALRAGADGYITKLEATERVVEAIREVLDGRIYLNQSIAEELLRSSSSGGRYSWPVDAVSLLSDRELETYRLLGEGKSVKEIALQLAKSFRTIETFIARIKKKLLLEDREKLIKSASEWVQRHLQPGSGRDG